MKTLFRYFCKSAFASIAVLFTIMLGTYVGKLLIEREQSLRSEIDIRDKQIEKLEKRLHMAKVQRYMDSLQFIQRHTAPANLKYLRKEEQYMRGQ